MSKLFRGTFTYICIDGKWYRTYRRLDWYDTLCWVLALAMLFGGGYALAYWSHSC